MKTIKVLYLWHPESPGEKVLVFRNWWQRLIYPKHFATLGETIKYGKSLLALRRNKNTA